MSAERTEPITRGMIGAVYVALLLLLGLTAWASHWPTGRWSLPIALAIATLKLALIFTYFMRLRHSGGLVRIFALAGFFWLSIASVLTFADYLTR